MKRPLFIGGFAALLGWANVGAALELSLPSNAVQTAERNTDPDRYDAPLGVFTNGVINEVEVEGAVRRTAWRLDSPGLTPFQVMRPLRAQLVAAGFDVVLDCEDQACGGFDFRFAIETLPGPSMSVNLRSYHFVTAVRPSASAPDEVVTILTSSSANSAYVQIIQAGALDEGSVEVAATADLPVVPQSAASSDLAGQLFGAGHVVLSDLDFETGTSDLGKGPFASLGKLAAFLQAQPKIKVALVGHTDSVGGLDGNIALSRRRAQSVRARLINSYGVDPTRMDAQGMGYLAPVASNLTDAGRDANRRVEVVVLSSD
jgi:OOP family OmpA-OmpF porin